ncbi:MAG: hypothetical protein B6D44_02120 [Ignavibacteriales bacterium UTCHB2]|jgi:hypothetical protein|nr:MAG: hypothetical protein B6D44_02120 [Ignavibacteriales bacterium UTCHB2]HQI41283.1 hypothetical protein [Ignavibacteriaceae bacterium]
MEETIISILIILISIGLLTKLKGNFIFILPVLNVIFDVLTGFIPTSTVSNNWLAVSRASINLLFIFYYFLNFKIRFGKFKIIFIFLIYLLILVPFSSDLSKSGINYLKYAESIVLFPISYAIINNEKKINLLNSSIFYILVIITVNFIAANVFKVGQNLYSETVEYYGGGFHLGGLNTLAVIIILIPFLYNNLENKYKIAVILLGIVVAIFLILSLKRATIIAPIIGYLTLFLFSRTRTKLFKLFISFSIVIFLLSPFYINVLDQMIYARKNRLDVSTIEEEMRYKEIFIVIDERIYNHSKNVVLFGKEIFNSAWNYGNGMYRSRELHTDFAVILHGSGLIGLLFFTLLHIYFISKGIFHLNFKSSVYTNKYLPTYFALIVLSIVLSFSRGLGAISFQMILYIYLGALIRMLDNRKLLNDKSNIKYLNGSK